VRHFLLRAELRRQHVEKGVAGGESTTTAAFLPE